MPYIHYRQQQPQSITSKMPSVLNPVIHQDMGKFWSQVLTRSMERKSVVAVPCPVTRKIRPPLVFANAETSMGRGRPCFEGNIPLALPGTNSYMIVLTALFCWVQIGLDPLDFPKQRQLIPLVRPVCSEGRLFHSTPRRAEGLMGCQSLWSVLQ